MKHINGYCMVRKTENTHEWAYKTKGTRWIKIKNLKTKNRDRKKEYIQGYRDLRELLSKGMIY